MVHRVARGQNKKEDLVQEPAHNIEPLIVRLSHVLCECGITLISLISQAGNCDRSEDLSLHVSTKAACYPIYRVLVVHCRAPSLLGSSSNHMVICKLAYRVTRGVFSPSRESRNWLLKIPMDFNYRSFITRCASGKATLLVFRPPVLRRHSVVTFADALLLDKGGYVWKDASGRSVWLDDIAFRQPDATPVKLSHLAFSRKRSGKQYKNGFFGCADHF